MQLLSLSSTENPVYDDIIVRVREHPQLPNTVNKQLLLNPLLQMYPGIAYNLIISIVHQRIIGTLDYINLKLLRQKINIANIFRILVLDF